MQTASKIKFAGNIKNPCRIPEEKRRDVINNAGGVYNHRFYFNGMSPDCHGLERGALHRKMSESFTSFENFKMSLPMRQCLSLARDMRGLYMTVKN